MRTRDLDEAIEAVGQVYCSHRVQVRGAPRAVDVQLEVTRPTTQPLVRLSYGTPVRIDAGPFPRLFLMMHCADGSARARQGRHEAPWRAGQTLPLSADHDTELMFDAAFVQRGIRLDADRLELLCARWLGHPLTHPLRFALRPFSPELESAWQRTLHYMWSFEANGWPLVGAAKTALDEYALTLLLHQLPHNHSDELHETPPTPVPALIRRAERLISERAESAITTSEVAAELGVSVRTLQQGFRQFRATTPVAYLRHVRLQLAREQILRRDSSASVTEIAFRFGFSHLGRFGAYYRAAYGESPSVTWRRMRGSR